MLENLFGDFITKEDERAILSYLNSLKNIVKLDCRGIHFFDNNFIYEMQKTGKAELILTETQKKYIKNTTTEEYIPTRKQRSRK